MAEAGFVYTPQEYGDDTATCVYCDTSLSGWEPEDDPLYVACSLQTRADAIYSEEHRKRNDKCPIFTATLKDNEPAASKPKRGKSTVARLPESDDDEDPGPPPVKSSSSRSLSKKGKEKENTAPEDEPPAKTTRKGKAKAAPRPPTPSETEDADMDVDEEPPAPQR